MVDAFRHHAQNRRLPCTMYDYEVCRASDDVPMIDISLAVKGWDSHLQCSPHHGPLAAPLVGVVTCTYKQYIRPISSSRRYCDLPVSDRCMQRFLYFRLICGINNMHDW